MRGLITVDDFAKSGGMSVKNAGTVLGSANIVHKHKIAYGLQATKNVTIRTKDIWNKGKKVL